MIKNISLAFVSILFGILFISCDKNTSPSGSITTPVITKVVIDDGWEDKRKYTLPKLPDTLSFAGEKIPMDSEDIRDRLTREMVVQVNFHSRTLLMLKRLGKWEEVIRQELKKNDMPEDFLYLAIAESELNNEITSGKGAAGMWQFMPASAREYGLIVTETVDQRRNPFLATKAACEYLKESKKQFGTWVNAMASYNRGRRGLQNALTGQKQTDYLNLFMNQETSRYVFRILAMKLVYGDPIKYGFHLEEEMKSKRFTFKTVGIKPGKYNAVDLAASYGLSFKTLKDYNPWVRDTKNYKIKLKDSIQLYLPIDAELVSKEK